MSGLKSIGNGNSKQARTLVFGGAGFIGTNLADRLCQRGRRVRIFDNISRVGAARNLDWLLDTHGGSIDVHIGDVRDEVAVREAVNGVDEIYHLAAQVALTTSVVDPALDFDVNLRGTFHVLEAVRRLERRPPILFTSTSKVYGVLPDLSLVAEATRYRPTDPQIDTHGVSESHPLDFQSPYGCSKGAADQYVLDYARTYDLQAIVFRTSCIYGPHQHGTEDQGWVAHFMSNMLEDRPITIYGSGRQVRDLLFVDDLIDAMIVARDRVHELSGRAFNVGGGPENTLSLLELLEVMRRLSGRRPEVTFADWRLGDQRYYVSNIDRLSRATGWRPAVSVSDGLEALWRWLEERPRAPEERTELVEEPRTRTLRVVE
jgi:CDP-paratose 2-epimerase